MDLGRGVQEGDAVSRERLLGWAAVVLVVFGLLVLVIRNGGNGDNQ